MSKTKTRLRIMSKSPFNNADAKKSFPFIPDRDVSFLWALYAS